MRMTIIERAYDLAKDGSCRSLDDIASTLKREHFAAVDAHLRGATIRKSLKAAMAARVDA